MTLCSILSHGLRFYLPGLSDGRLLNAIDQYEYLLNLPEEAPAAIAAWPGFDLEQLPQSVRDRDEPLKVRYCRDVKVPFGYEIAGIADDGRLVLLEITPDAEASCTDSDLPCLEATGRILESARCQIENAVLDDHRRPR
jgi:hypothetical protein